MLTSKQRAYLRGLANTINPIIIIGKEGITEPILKEIDQALEYHELIKIKLLETSFLTSKSAAEEICSELNAEAVQCIGSKLVIYKQSTDNKTIVLPKK